MDVAVFGAGYVGCVTAACLAGFGHTVRLVEVAPEKLTLLRAGRSPVFEPGLDEELGTHLRSGRVIVVTSAAEAVNHTTLALVCVGTPSHDDGLPNVSQVRRVIGEIAEALAADPRAYVIALRSTIPYPQVRDLLLPLLERRLGKQFGTEVTLALNPEFLREGKALADFRRPPFVVVGTESAAAAEALAELNRGVDAPFLVVSPGSASMLKYACNAFHAMKVAFANEIASLEDAFEADAASVMEMFVADRVLNVSPAYLRPGYAFGGACLPKDLRALNRVAALAGVSTPLLESVLRSNATVVQRSVDIVERLGVRDVALLGLSFKPGTDDLRESPLVELAERLLGKGYRLRIYDPDVYPESLHGRNLQYVTQHLDHLGSLLRATPEEALAGAQLVIIGKAVPGAAHIVQFVPDGARMLDLTRDIQGAEPSPAPAGERPGAQREIRYQNTVVGAKRE